jgi:hypothetical protein
MSDPIQSLDKALSRQKIIMNCYGYVLDMLANNKNFETIDQSNFATLLNFLKNELLIVKDNSLNKDTEEDSKHLFIHCYKTITVLLTSNDDLQGVEHGSLFFLFNFLYDELTRVNDIIEGFASEILKTLYRVKLYYTMFDIYKVNEEIYYGKHYFQSIT